MHGFRESMPRRQPPESAAPESRSGFPFVGECTPPSEAQIGFGEGLFSAGTVDVDDAGFSAHIPLRSVLGDVHDLAREGPHALHPLFDFRRRTEFRIVPVDIQQKNFGVTEKTLQGLVELMANRSGHFQHPLKLLPTTQFGLKIQNPLSCQHTRPQFFVVKGLDNIIVRSGLKPFDEALALASGGE